MKYIKFTYVDAATGISVASEPALNGTKFPAVQGLEYVWARESAYPTPVPEFFGTCPDESSVDVAGVIGLFAKSDWEQMRSDEMSKRSPVPQTLTARQAKLVLLSAGLLDSVNAAVAAADRATQIEWEYATEMRRDWPTLQAMATALGMTDAQLDELFIAGAAL